MSDSSGSCSPENLPILHHHDHQSLNSLKIHRKSMAGMRRDPSYEFWNDDSNNSNENSGHGIDWGSRGRSGSFDFSRHGGTAAAAALEDPQVLQRQRNNGEIALDMDLENDESCHAPTTARSSKHNDASRDVSVSFEIAGRSGGGGTSSSSSAASSAANSSRHTNRDDQVVRCTSNASYQKSNLLSRIKTKSRLKDPNLDEEQRYSGWIGKSGPIKQPEDEEDDPLAGEDIPEKYRRSKLDTLTLIQWISLIIITTALTCSLSIHRLKKLTLWDLHIWKWEVFLLILICGRLVSGWIIRIIVFFIERNFLLRKKVLYFVYGLRKAVQNCLWLGLVLLAWRLLLDKKVQRDKKTKFLPNITKILVCFCVANILWLIKTLMVKVLASSFHVSTYFDRIQESVFNQYLIETLSGPPVVEISRLGEEDDSTRLPNSNVNLRPDLCGSAFPPGRSGRVIGFSMKLSPAVSNKISDNGITIDHLHKLNHKNVSAWNMKRLMKIVRKASLTTLDEQMLDTRYEDESARQIRSENEAKAAARKIFKNVAQPGSRYIYQQDLMRFLRDEEALKAMSVFEGAIESKRISKSALKNWVVNAFRERRALALTLDDTQTAVNKLHQMVNVLAGAAIFVIWLLILGITTSKSIVFISSQFVLLAFMFGNTVKTIFESIIFLFFVHPYDVGDRCEIDGEQMVVEEMNILSTVFLRYDSLKILYPNSVLWQKPISNYYRSPDMGDAIEFCVHIATPFEKIAAIRQRILSYIENKTEHWYPTARIIVKDIEDLNRMRIAVWPCHRYNHQDMGERHARRALLVEEIVRILKELDLQFRLLPLDINIKTMPTVASGRVPIGWSQNSS